MAEKKEKWAGVPRHESYRNPFEFEKNFEYPCNGPAKRSCGSPPKEVVGTMMTMAKCLQFPDCTCKNYVDACTEHENLLEM